MLITETIILILTAFIGGYSLYWFPKIRENNFDYLLIFAGAYLFSITVIHIMPEVYSEIKEDPYKIGLFVLAGFILQKILGAMSSGLEHGHLHVTTNHMNISPIVLLIGLGVHSFLEGTILAHPVRIALHNHSGGILLGIVLHRISAAVALVAILNAFYRKKTKVIVYLVIFSLCTPAGLWVTTYLGEHRVFSLHEMAILYAIVCGSFLHISTTIFFESNPQHHFDYKRFISLMVGAGLAVAIELFF